MVSGCEGNPNGSTWVCSLESAPELARAASSAVSCANKHEDKKIRTATKRIINSKFQIALA
jgi:hypothetical protein